MSVNQQRKIAMKRLASDQQELMESPVAGVSAAPLDENMFEWHCNFLFNDVPYHVVLFFPENYPYVSPSAEYVPSGFQFIGGATKPGKKGTQVCLSIFSDFANWHKEWADQKGMGWSPGYTVQTVLLNMVAFLADMSGESVNQVFQNNAKLANSFTCKDCGHTAKKPYPPFEDGASTSAKNKPDSGKPTIVDYISKVKFQVAKPKSKEDLYGYGLIRSGPPHRPALTSPCEFLSGESYFGMKKSIGKVQSVLKEDLSFFLPLYIHPTHGEGIQATFEESMRELADLLPGCDRKKTPLDEMVTKTIPNLMSATVVEFSKGTQHTSDNHLGGYFALHRLFLWAIKTYPELQDKIDLRLKEFIDDVEKRTKKACPHIGEWLMLLSGSAKYKWKDAADAYLSESWKRNVMWFVKDDKKLGFLDTDQKYRLDKTLKATEVSRKLLAFQVLFLDIAMPDKMSRNDIIKRYDNNYGLPTPQMVTQMKEACQRIEGMKTYPDWFKVLKLDPPSDAEIFQRLLYGLEYSINTNGYHWSFFKNQGGWAEVLKRYPKGTPNWTGKAKNAPKGGAEAGADEPKGKGKGRGKTSAGKAKPEPKVGAAKAAQQKRKADSSEDESSSEEDEPAPKGRGRGRGRGKAAGRGRAKQIKGDDNDDDDQKPVGRGRGRGKREADAVPAAGGRGRGRGKREADAVPAAGGRGGNKRGRRK